MNESMTPEQLATLVRGARVGWFAIGLLVVAWECYWLGKGVLQATLSYQLWTIRFDSIGRFIVLPFGCWFVMHIMIAPKWLMVRADWRSLPPIALGLLWAAWETWGKR